jgi:hypothetical protein
MSLKARALIVQARGRWELTHDGDDVEMKNYIDLAVAEIFAEKLETILDAIGV